VAEAIILALIVAVLADWLLAVLAESVAATWATTLVGTRPVVRIQGWPLLPQVVRGRYSRVYLRGDNMTIGDVGGVSGACYLHGVQVSIWEALRMMRGRSGRVRCARAVATVSMTHGQMAALVPISGLELSHAHGSLVASVPVAVPGTFLRTTIRARARLEVDERGGMRVRLRRFGALQLRGGSRVPDALVLYVLGLLGVATSPAQRPTALHFRSVAVTPEGLRIEGTCERVTINLLRR
jgi:hypothetical protein